MILWIEAQSIFVITLLVFGFCYGLMLAIMGVALIVSRRPIAKQLKATSPVTLTPLAVILALLIAFLASRVWTNVDRAGEYVGREASALREALLLADALPADVRLNVRAAVKRHLHFVVTEDWPAMARIEASLQHSPVGLTEAITSLLSFETAQPTRQLAQRRALAALEQAFESRQRRIQLSHLEIAPVQWTVVLVLTVLILMTIAMIHIDNRAAMAATMAIFSTAVAVCVILLMAYDRPFASGGVTMQPTLFQAIVVD
jgi:amino acid transporter